MERSVIHLQHRPENPDVYGTPWRTGPPVSGSSISRRVWPSCWTITSATIEMQYPISSTGVPCLHRTEAECRRRWFDATSTSSHDPV